MDVETAREGRIKFEVPGEPMAWQRRGTAKGRSYTPKKTFDYKIRIQERFAALFPGFTPLTGPLKVTIRAFFKIPQSASQKRQREMLAGIIIPEKTPDWDNIGKSPSDALNGIAYLDDKQIANGQVIKRYSDRPRLEIEIEKEGEG